MRPTKYDKSMPEKVEQYLKPFRAKLTGRKQFYELPTIAGLADFLGVHKATVHRWEKKHAEFHDSLGCLMGLQEHSHPKPLGKIEGNV